MTPVKTDEQDIWKPLSEAVVSEKYTDYPPNAQYLTCWLYRQDGSDHLSHSSDHADFDEVVKNLLRTLGELSQSKNKRLRERQFTIWWGDPHYLIIGIPEDSPLPLKQFMHDRMNRAAGYECSESTEASQSTMSYKFRYEAGRIIVYDDPSLAGLVTEDTDYNYGSGVTVEYRAKGPLWLTGGVPKYQEG